MLWNASAINGYAIEAKDGRIGTVSDFLFDDTTWLIRWLVVDTGKWLPGRRVLLPPSALGHIDQESESFSVRLAMSEVKDSPNIDADRPVSRQMESHVYDYYGWNPYWSPSFLMGDYGYLGGAYTPATPSRASKECEELIARSQQHTDDDPHLRSAAAVSGYHIKALDGEIGHVEDFFVDDADWSIHYLLVDTRNWWPGKKVLISPRSAKDIDWTHKRVDLNVDRETVKNGPAYDPAMYIDRDYVRKFHGYYGGIQPTHPR
jgi:hypothetical protein